MKKTCPVCNKQFVATRKDKTFCSKACVYKQYNDKRPRKTNKSYFKANELRKKHIPEEQLSVIFGTVMGDATLILQTNNFHRLSLCHAEKQVEYLKLKKNILNSIFIQEKINHYTRKDGLIQYHSHSISHKDLTNVYGLFYRNKKKIITRKLLNHFTPTSLLFWYLDDGSLIKSSGNTIIFCTDSFTLGEVKTIKTWLWQEYDIESKILPSYGSYSKKEYYRLRLTKDNTVRFFSIVSTSLYFKRAVKAMPYKFKPYFSN